MESYRGYDDQRTEYYHWSEVDFIPFHRGRPTKIEGVPILVWWSQWFDNRRHGSGVDIWIGYYPKVRRPDYRMKGHGTEG